LLLDVRHVPLLILDIPSREEGIPFDDVHIPSRSRSLDQGRSGAGSA
jgi:hypothetical protein